MNADSKLKNLSQNEIDAIRNSSLFDEEWYVEKYGQEVLDADPFEHFISVGIFNGNDPGADFNTKSYLNRYPDLKRSGIPPLIHYILFGIPEGRIAAAENVSSDLPLTSDYLADYIDRYGFRVGRHTYGYLRILEPESSILKIGNFCSIGPNVDMILGNHRIDTISTYPFRALIDRWPTVGAETQDHRSRGDIIIGHDVWIGANVTILSGVKIGTGAVIGACSVIREDIPEYAVAIGNPSKVVKKRFDADTIEQLLKIAWWNWPDELIAKFLPKMMDSDTASFILAAQEVMNFAEE